LITMMPIAKVQVDFANTTDIAIVLTVFFSS